MAFRNSNLKKNVTLNLFQGLNLFIQKNQKNEKNQTNQKIRDAEINSA